jgi:hypothetical protein
MDSKRGEWEIMTIGEFKEWLKEENVPDTVEMVLSSDPEGNRFYTVDELNTAFVSGTGHATEVEFEDDVSQDENYKPCLVLWP